MIKILFKNGIEKEYLDNYNEGQEAEYDEFIDSVYNEIQENHDGVLLLFEKNTNMLSFLRLQDISVFSCEEKIKNRS